MPEQRSDPAAGRLGLGADAAAQAEQRMQAWQQALEGGTLPDFVERRLTAAAAKQVPWLSTMTPAELLLTRRYGIEPIATVSGTCWYHYGFSWTKGHAEGWHLALERLRREAIAAGAHAVVDVKLRTLRSHPQDVDAQNSMDYSVVGTAVRFTALPPNPDPVIATVSAIEFVRLLEAGIVATGVAIGAHYEWLTVSQAEIWDMRSGMNGPCRELTGFWERVRRQALDELQRDAGRLGTGVLAHTHFGELIKPEQDERRPVQVLGRHIVIGTAVETQRFDRVPHDITPVLDMRVAQRPSSGGKAAFEDAYSTTAEEGAV